jgi:hypothetical protein
MLENINSTISQHDWDFPWYNKRLKVEGTERPLDRRADKKVLIFDKQSSRDLGGFLVDEN